MALLEVENLRAQFRVPGGVNRAVNGVSFEVNQGETLAIGGESGSGYSVTSMSMMRLIPIDIGMIDGSVKFNGRDLLSLTEQEMRKVRGRDIAMVFQEPMTSLNPVLTIGYQLSEAVRLHANLNAKDVRRRVLEMLCMVGISAPEKRMKEYSHQLSGGMRQRVMIAMALACNPKLLIADEPTTALDVTIQAQILDLIKDLKGKTQTSIVIITHDLGVVAETADRVMVMYAGRKVEEAPVKELFSNPRHPYTSGLLGAMPRLGSSLSGNTGRLTEIKGTVVDLTKDIHGCAFASRCPLVSDICKSLTPALETVSTNHTVACHHSERTGIRP